MSTQHMPTIAMTRLSTDAKQIVKAITKKDGTVFSSKPKNATGLQKYVWRHVAYHVSSLPQHHREPICAEADLHQWIEANDSERLVSSRKYASMSVEQRKGYNTVETVAKTLKSNGYLQGLIDEIVANASTVPNYMLDQALAA